jgi:hypothetical protein
MYQVSKGQQVDSGRKVTILSRAYYLLGWLVGDAGKGFSDRSFMARVEIGLCKGHVDNLALGRYVVNYLTILGISTARIKDGKRTESEPHGSFRWQSTFSQTVAWFHTACLGLGWSQRTSRDPVRIRWLLNAKREYRLWFLRGIADSDGSVNVRNRTVVITSSPNTELFAGIFRSLGVLTSTWDSGGTGYVEVKAKDAWSLKLFNPDVRTYRRTALERLVKAKAYPVHWPEWLEAKVHRLLVDGQDCPTIRNILLSKYGTYVKLKTLRRKELSLNSRRRALLPRPRAYEARALLG